jgi:predicted outer membrane repeat protein
MKKFLLHFGLLMLGTLLLHAANAQASYVDASRQSSGDGTSWGTAYKTLAEAIQAAGSNSSITQILVATGTYYPTGTQSGTNRDSAFTILRGNLKIYGGYPAGGGARNLANNPTILSGDIATANTHTNNSYHIMVIAGVAYNQDSVVVDGFLFRWGYANNGSSKAYNGQTIQKDRAGGLAIWGCANGNRITIRNCVFAANYAGDAGGGMFVNASSPLIAGCLFAGNNADYGGGLCNAAVSPVTLANCTFASNLARSTGGAMRNSSSNPYIANCIIYGNSNGISNNSATPVISFSLVQGLGSTANDNLDGSINPQFINLVNYSLAPMTGGDYHLSSNSPCINRGSNPARPFGMPYDMDGRYGIAGCVTDMGAYEYPNPPNPTTLYVDSSRVSSGTGTSWGSAYKTLREALTLAHACNTVSSILVAKGTYYPTGVQWGTDQAAAFGIVRGGLKVEGGYPSGGGARNIATNKTILNGNIKNTNSESDNSYHVMVIAGLPANADSVIIDGFTFTQGWAYNQAAYTLYNGRAVYANKGGALALVRNDNGARNCIRNCTFFNNKAVNMGGAIYSSYSSSVITACIFLGNDATKGAGTAIEDSWSFISNTVFSANTGYYSAALNVKYATAFVVNCAFTGNHTDDGPAVNLELSENTTQSIVNCTFSGNNGYAIQTFSTNATVANCIIYGNGNAVASYSPFTANIKNSIVQGGYAGSTNLDVNPLFVNAPSYAGAPFSTGDYRLQAGSPAINQGDNNAVPSTISTDLAGNTRIVGCLADAGAYEYQAPTGAKIISAQPQSTGACAGSAPGFSVTAPSFASYQWQVNNGSGFSNVPGTSPYSGGTSSTLTINPAMAAMNGYSFRCQVSGCGPVVTSASATLSIYASTLYVDSSVASSGTGAGWASAYKTLGEALALAHSCNTVSSILVAKGTYYPTGAQPGTDKSAAFGIVRGGLKILGGYPSGGGTRNISTNKTILNGNINDPDNVFDNSYHIMVIASLPANADSVIIDGFTFTQGAAYHNMDYTWYNGNPVYADNGGALALVHNDNGARNCIRNCTFSNNKAIGLGGAIYSTFSSSVITACIFSGNDSYKGGGMAIENYSYSFISNTVFSANTAGTGAALNGMFATAFVVNSAFTGNQTVNNGSAINIQQSVNITQSIVNCTFSGNNEYAIQTYSTNATVANCIIYGNGNAVASYSPFTASIHNSIIQGGYAGSNNLDADPIFTNGANPAGADGIWGTADDGLRLQVAALL